MFADLDKCERIYQSKSKGFDQKRARTFENDLGVFKWRCSHMYNTTNKKLALLFLIYDEINHEKLWYDYLSQINNRTSPHKTDVKYSIYIHYKNNKELKFFEKNKINNSIDTKWGDISLVKAQNVLLGEALKDKNNTHFIFLSNSCIPLKNFNHIYDNIQLDKSYFNIAPNGIFPRYDNIKEHTDSNNIMKASQWSILCRKHADILYNDRDIYCKWFENTPIPDEGAYITYLNHMKCQNELITTNNSANNATTFTNWSDMDYKYVGNESPKYYKNITNDEFDYLVNNSKCFFGRKFHQECNLSYLYKLLSLPG
jgi:hypothetical protein